MSIVAESTAIEELAIAIGKDIGQLSKLGTVDKSNLVDAINEAIGLRPVGSTVEEDIISILSRLDVIEQQLGITT